MSRQQEQAAGSRQQAHARVRQLLLLCPSLLTHRLEVLVVVVAIVGKAEGVDVVPLPRAQAALALALSLRTPLVLRPAISWWLGSVEQRVLHDSAGGTRGVQEAAGRESGVATVVGLLTLSRSCAEGEPTLNPTPAARRVKVSGLVWLWFASQVMMSHT